MGLRGALRRRTSPGAVAWLVAGRRILGGNRENAMERERAEKVTPRRLRGGLGIAQFRASPTGASQIHPLADL